MTLNNWIPVFAAMSGSTVAALVAIYLARRNHEDAGRWAKINAIIETREGLDPNSPMREWLTEYIDTLLRAYAVSETSPRLRRFLIPWFMTGFVSTSGCVLGLVASLSADKQLSIAVAILLPLGFVGMACCLFVRIPPQTPTGAPAQRFNGEIDVLRRKAIGLYPEIGARVPSSIGSELLPKKFVSR
jgi:hypothetical protein